MYVDVLKAPSLLSLSLQDENLDIVLGIKQILKSSKALKSMASQDPLQWPTVQLVCSGLRMRREARFTKEVFSAITHFLS